MEEDEKIEENNNISEKFMKKLTFMKELTKLSDDVGNLSVNLYENKGFITDLRKLKSDMEYIIELNKDVEEYIIELNKDIEKMVIRINKNKEFAQRLTTFENNIEKMLVTNRKSIIAANRKCMNNLNEAERLIRITRDNIENLAYLDGTTEKE